MHEISNDDWELVFPFRKGKLVASEDCFRKLLARRTGEGWVFQQMHSRKNGRVAHSFTTLLAQRY